MVFLLESSIEEKSLMHMQMMSSNVFSELMGFGGIILGGLEVREPYSPNIWGHGSEALNGSLIALDVGCLTLVLFRFGLDTRMCWDLDCLLVCLQGGCLFRFGLDTRMSGSRLFAGMSTGWVLHTTRSLRFGATTPQGS
jgi:hypothetical protein